jgi:LL-diaminopimelate aminotransferase
MKRRYGVNLDPATEILPTIGSKEAIAHLPLAVLNPGDVALVPDPRYPVYWSSVTFAGAEPKSLPLRAENGFLPDLDAIPLEWWKRTRLVFVNYPNNPTGAIAPRPFYERLVALAHEHRFVLAVDAAYNEIYFEQAPISVLQIPGAREVSIELHSLSKTFNMTGWRVGFALGNPGIIAALAQVKANADSGIFTAIQMAAVTALDHYESLLPPIRRLYLERRDALSSAFERIGWSAPKPPATFYMWIPCPKGVSSMEAAGRILEEAAVVLTPGVGFGAASEGYIRAALTVETPRLLEAVDRISKMRW